MENIKNTDYKTQLNEKGVISFVPAGDSMWPILKHRNQSVVIEKKSGRLSPFDVAFYVRDNGVFVLHRVVEVTENGYIFSGDSQLVTESINEEQVFGKMVGFYKGKKYIDCTTPKYTKKIKRMYANKSLRKFKIKYFYLAKRIKAKISRIFRRNKNNVWFNSTW